jgi:tight adherence protein B
MSAILIAILAFAAVAAAGWVLGGNHGDEKAAKRAKELTQPKRKRADANTAEQANTKRKAQNAEALKDLGERQKRSRKSMLSIKGQIAQAGLSFPDTTFWIGSGALAVVLALVAFVMQAPPLVIGGMVLIGGLGLPRWILKFLIGARQKKFASQMADGIDVIVRGVKSGLPLNQCLRIISTESQEPLRSEFQNLVDGQTMGIPLDQNLQKMYERMPLPEVNFFSIVLIIQQKTGGNLSEALGNLSTVLRSRKLLKAKINALSSEAKASAGIIGSLPFIVAILVYFVRPDYILMLFTDKTGNLILLGAAVMMSMGIMVMRNMINFKF